MNVYVRVYERCRKRDITWSTLGLGEADHAHTGRNRGKLRRTITRVLQRRLAKVNPGEQSVFVPTPGTRMQLVSLELTMRSDGSRFQVSGRFPVVVEPRRASAAETLHVAYHPLRQTDWFPVDPSEPLADQARAAFQKAWAGLSLVEIEALRGQARDCLKLISVQVTPKTLLGELPRKQSAESALAGARRKRPQGACQVLPDIGVDETMREIDGALSPGRPRQPYRTQLQQLICCPRPRSVLLVGPSGVGKTALTRRLVADRLEYDDYPTHRNPAKCASVWRISGRRLIAGMSRVGEWEERAMGVLEDCRRKRTVLACDDVHAFPHLGKTVQSDRNLAELFAGPVGRGELAIIGECTAEQLQLLEDHAPAFAAAFTRIFVNEPPVGETLSLLIHQARKVEKAHRVRFSPFAHRANLELCRSLFGRQAFPGKALDLQIRVARNVAPLACLPKRGAAGRKDGETDIVVVGNLEVLEHVAAHTGLPRVLLEPEAPLDPARVASDLSRWVMGQPEAIAAMRDLVVRLKAGLQSPGKPYGVFLFTGPTGTGKTELTRCLSTWLYGSEARLVRFDMSEYAGPDAAARLIGHTNSPEGLLTRRLREQPFCVLLLDEIEKAHPRALHLLLQVFDEGRLTDAAGNTADFSHAVVVMTSNLGASSRARPGFGDRVAKEGARDIENAVREFFPPELFNRIDHVVAFRAIAPDVARLIAAKELRRLLTRRGLTDRNVFVTCGDSVLDLVCRDGFDVRDGARSLKRYLDRTVGRIVADALVSSPPSAMRYMRLYCRPGGVQAYTQGLQEAEALEPPSPLEPMLAMSSTQLRDELPAAIAFLEDLAGSPELAGMAQRVSTFLKAYNIGQSGVADEIFNVDSLREHTAQLVVRLSAERDRHAPDPAEQLAYQELARTRLITVRDRWQTQRVRLVDRRALIPREGALNRSDLLLALAEVMFLRRAVNLATDPRRHAVMVTLLRVGQPSGSGANGRFEEPGEGLLDALSAVYRDARGELEGVASGDRLVAVKLAGLCVLDAFAGEEGCHIRTGVGADPEVVRVTVRYAPAEEEPQAVLDAFEDARIRFARALDEGHDPLPVDPEALLPVVRRYDFQSPDPTRPTTYAVEDYRLAYAHTQTTRRFDEVVLPLMLLHMTRGVSE